MPPVSKLLHDVEALRGDVALIGSLAEVVGRWPELAGQVGDITSAEALLDRMIADVGDDLVVQAFGRIDGGEALRARLGQAVQRVKQEAGKLSPQARLLLTATASIPAEAGDDHPG